MDALTKRPQPVMLSKRANVFYLEHAKVMQEGERVVFLTQDGGAFERMFNVPERNTAFLLLGKGTSITDAAARRLAASNVIVGFVVQVEARFLKRQTWLSCNRRASTDQPRTCSHGANYG